MATLKVYDGTAWQVVAGQGSPGVGVPSGGAAGNALVKASATSFDLTWGGDNEFANWTVYTPRFSTDTGYEAGMTPGTGGSNWGAYRMIAPYTMAIRTRFMWGSSGGNGGATGAIAYSIPAGYGSDPATYQYMTCYVWTGDNFQYLGLVHVYPNDIWMRPCTPFPGPIDRYIGTQGRVATAGTMVPTNWYPNGGISIWGVLNVGPRW